MKSIQYYDFYLRHRISLQEYLEKHYSLTFTDQAGSLICDSDPHLSIHEDGQYENTWVQSNAATGEKSKHGSFLQYGTVLNWESIKHDCSIVEAVGIVLKNKDGLQNYKTKHYQKLESLFNKVALRFRYSRSLKVGDYLTERGLDYTSYAKEFGIGSPKSYEALVNDLVTTKTTSHDIAKLLEELFIIKNPKSYEYLPFAPAVTVPVFDKEGDFVGYHGKIIHAQDSQGFYSTGFLRERAKEVLYGEDKPGIRSAINEKKQLILTKGIFDFFTCYQSGSEQVLATMDQGISAQQFDRVLEYPISEIIVGFTAPIARDTILGLMQKSLEQIDVSIIDDSRDIDELIKSGDNLSEIISKALRGQEATESGVIAASLKSKKAQMDALTELGLTFLIPEDELAALVSSSKKSPQKIKNFLKEKENEGLTEGVEGKYLRIPKTFVTDDTLDRFGAELRTLLHLLTKTKGGQNPINYTQSALSADLGLSQAVLIDHTKKLKTSGYLLWKKETKVEQLKTKRKRHVVFKYYPTTIEF